MYHTATHTHETRDNHAQNSNAKAEDATRDGRRGGPAGRARAGAARHLLALLMGAAFIQDHRTLPFLVVWSPLPPMVLSSALAPRPCSAKKPRGIGVCENGI